MYGDFDGFALNKSLGGGFQLSFIFTLYFEKISKLTHIFSGGLKPPTRSESCIVWVGIFMTFA